MEANADLRPLSGAGIAGRAQGPAALAPVVDGEAVILAETSASTILARAPFVMEYGRDYQVDRRSRRRQAVRLVDRRQSVPGSRDRLSATAWRAA